MVTKKKLNIIVTGGAGFIGVEVCYHLFNQFKNYNIHIIDKLTYSGNKIFLKSLLKSKRVFCHFIST